MMNLGFLRQQIALLIDKYGEETAVLMMDDNDKICDVVGWAEARAQRNNSGGWVAVVCFLPGKEVRKYQEPTEEDKDDRAVKEAE